MSIEDIPRTITLAPDGTYVQIVDQTKLPYELSYSEIRSWKRMIEAIQRLEIRGAPALGVAGAAAVCLFVASRKAVTEKRSAALEYSKKDFIDELDEVCDAIATARPTAVNLSWGVERVRKALRTALSHDADLGTLCECAIQEVEAIRSEDEASCRAIGAYGAACLPADARVLTHCNAGSLATAYFGTALGVIYSAYEQGRISRVYADETRPVGQGARLTAWELGKAGIPTTLICDNMAASLMAQGEIDAVIVGADRICANGDIANKIGTYGLAVLAKQHGIPFYVAAPLSTIDWSLTTGTKIPIEQRDRLEVLPRPIEGVDVINPAFDITPGAFISAIITDKGVFTPAELSSLKGALMDSPVWLVTGASRGFGREFAACALAHGCRVVATARKPEAISAALGEHEHLLPVALDVTDQEQIDKAIRQAIDAFGRIDVLVNNAGYGVFGALEELTDAETRAIFDTNVFGALNVTRTVLPHMRKQGSGRIVMLGSIASYACDPGGALYDGGKAVLASVSEVLSIEMKPFGIESMVLLPGMFRTNFFDGSSIKRPEHTLAAYDDSPARSAEDYCLGHNYQQNGDPKKAAELVYQIVSSSRPLPLWLPLGKDAVKKFEKQFTRMIDSIQPYKDAASDLFIDAD